ncbi:MAG: hypothetical protein J0L54_00330 [Chitinophagales bacterium]|nr:hypothetical protein [Chitinophagales bacterium]
MKTTPLLPNRYKKIGWVIFIPAILAGLMLSILDFNAAWLTTNVFAIWNDPIVGRASFFTVIKTDVTNTLVGALFIIGGMMVGFSREKQEDEYIAELRLSSLLWAVCVSYVLLLLAFLFVYGGPFFTVMVYNMFTVLIIFIARFNYLLYRNAQSISHEK